MRAVLISIGLLYGTWAFAEAEDAVVALLRWISKMGARKEHSGLARSTPALRPTVASITFTQTRRQRRGIGAVSSPTVCPGPRPARDHQGERRHQVGERAARRVAVMLKDGARYRDTDGWGFEIFKGDDSPGADAEGKAACFACHGMQKGRDAVFSQFRK